MTTALFEALYSKDNLTQSQIEDVSNKACKLLESLVGSDQFKEPSKIEWNMLLNKLLKIACFTDPDRGMDIISKFLANECNYDGKIVYLLYQWLDHLTGMYGSPCSSVVESKTEYYARNAVSLSWDDETQDAVTSFAVRLLIRLERDENDIIQVVKNYPRPDQLAYLIFSSPPPLPGALVREVIFPALSPLMQEDPHMQQIAGQLKSIYKGEGCFVDYSILDNQKGEGLQDESLS